MSLTDVHAVAVLHRTVLVLLSGCFMHADGDHCRRYDYADAQRLIPVCLFSCVLMDVIQAFVAALLLNG